MQVRFISYVLTPRSVSNKQRSRWNRNNRNIVAKMFSHDETYLWKIKWINIHTPIHIGMVSLKIRAVVRPLPCVLFLASLSLEIFIEWIWLQFYSYDRRLKPNPRLLGSFLDTTEQTFKLTIAMRYFLLGIKYHCRNSHYTYTYTPFISL